MALPDALQFHISNRGLWFGDRLAIFQQSFQMERDGFTDIAFYLDGCPARRDATWQIGNVGGKIVFALFDYDCVFSHGLPRSSA